MPESKSPELQIEFWTGGSGARGVIEVLAAASRELTPSPDEGFGEAVSQLAFQLEQLRGVSQAQAEAVAENTQAVIQNTVAQATGEKGSVASTIGRTMRTVFTSGLGLSPLITGLVRWISGGDKDEVLPALPVYTSPPSIQFEGAVIRSAMAWPQIESQAEAPQGARGGQSPPELVPEAWPIRLMREEAGTRLFREEWPAGHIRQERSAGRFREERFERVVESRLAPVNVNVQVQAMDSRSFLDHSQEIARAVREAMLNSHALNDVVSEL